MHIVQVGVASLRGKMHPANEDRYSIALNANPDSYDRAISSNSSSISNNIISHEATMPLSGPAANNRNTISIFSVFDGHGGSNCSEFCSEKLHLNILKRCSAALGARRSQQGSVFPPIQKNINNNMADDLDDNNDEKYDSLITRAIGDSFEETENEFLEKAAKLDDYSGACAVVAVLRRDRLFVANLGDSRAVMGVKKQIGGGGPSAAAAAAAAAATKANKKRVSAPQNNYNTAVSFEPFASIVVPLSQDHKATAERERIQKAGGYVINGRVFGVLMVSRAFGDKEFKKKPGSGSTSVTHSAGGSARRGHHHNSSNVASIMGGGGFIGSSDGGGGGSSSSSTSTSSSKSISSSLSLDTPPLFAQNCVLATPEIKIFEITPATHFIIMATDGLWDVVNSQTAVALGVKFLKKHPNNMNKVAEELALEAVARGSMDDVTVLFILFGR